MCALFLVAVFQICGILRIQMVKPASWISTEQNSILQRHNQASAAKSFICNLLKSIDTSVSVEIMQPRSDTTPIEPIAIDIAKPGPVEDCWSRCGDVVLSKKDLQIILGGKELSDLHIDAFQNLVKMQFPHIGGLQTTLLRGTGNAIVGTCFGFAWYSKYSKEEAQILFNIKLLGLFKFILNMSFNNNTQ